MYLNYTNFSTSSNNVYYKLGHVRIGSKIGPSFTNSPFDKLEFDIYVRADFAWAAAVAMYEKEVGGAEDDYIGYVAIGFSTGLNLRYGILIIGFEFDTNGPELESNEYPGKYLGNVNDGNNSPLPCMKFIIGFSFWTSIEPKNRT